MLEFNIGAPHGEEASKGAIVLSHYRLTDWHYLKGPFLCSIKYGTNYRYAPYARDAFFKSGSTDRSSTAE
jgi:hypothetical protein